MAKYRRNRLLGMNVYNAARAAGYSESMARGKACRLDKSAKVSMEDALDRAGLTDAAISQELARIAKGATRLHACDVYVQKEADGSFKINENSNDFIEIPDEQARVKALELAAKLKGRLLNKVELSGELKTPKPLIIGIPIERQQDYANRLAGIPTG